jgi:coenzyme F420-reducing hydrogenase beta subunit
LCSCPTNAICMKEDQEGFLEPFIDVEKCTECGLCRKACPILMDSCPPRSDSPQTYAAWSLEESIRTDSSSGGVFSVLAEHVLSRAGVVFGAAFDSNFKLQHRVAKNGKELKELRGSKYIQSDIGDTYVKVQTYLNSGSQVMFVGTPCQVAGLYGYLRKDSPNLLTCDLVCHGVPSQRFFDEYLHYLSHNGYPKFDDISFRNKRGWGHAVILTENSGAGREIIVNGHHDYYRQSFLKGLISRKSCFTCKYARIPRTGDVTLGDFWGIGKEVPFRHDTRQGVSLFLVNSGHGHEVLRLCSNGMFLEERDLSEAKKENSRLYKTGEYPSGRDSFLIDIKNMSIEAMLVKYRLKKKLTLRELIYKVIRFGIRPRGVALLKELLRRQ